MTGTVRVAGLAIALAIAGPASAPAAGSGGDEPAVRTVRLVAKHSRWSVPVVRGVRAGETVRFVIRNDDPIDHELIIGPAEVHARHATGTEAHHGTVPGEVTAPAGSVVSTTYRFPAAGQVVFGCHLPGHWAHGMTGVVEVAST